MHPSLIARMRAAMALGFVAIATGGVVSAGLITPTRLGLAGVYLTLAAGLLAISAIAARATRWPLASTLALAWWLAFAWSAGPRACLALSGITIAALAAGSCVRVGMRSASLAIAIGLVVVGAMTGWLLSLPVHFAFAWWSVVAMLAAWRRRHLLHFARLARDRWRQGIASAPGSALLAVMAAGLASTSTWLPNLQADDLAYHLQLPTELLQHGAFQPDIRRQVWAYAPWLNDSLHGVVAVL